LSLSGILLMLIEPLLTRSRRNVLVSLAALGGGLALVSTIYPAMLPGTAFSGLLRIDGFSVFVHVVVEAVAFLVIIGSADYLDREHIQHGEYYALILFTTVGMCVMSSAAELMTAFVGLETSSISTYILASYRRDVPRSNESALKYFLLGSFATAFFLYGIALVYGATGTTQLARMTFPTTAGGERLLNLGLGLMLVGLAFKIAAAPFQLWTPDVYEGAPAPVTALMASGPKAAAFALLLRILATVAAAGTFWFWALWISAALTMFVGNLAAIAQHNVKRMLAYSSISHAGYILVALAAAAAQFAFPSQRPRVQPALVAVPSGIGDGHRGQESAGVRVAGKRIYVVAGADLDDLAEVHDGHAVAHVAHDREVVCDEHHREAELALHLAQQVEDLRLDRDVERGDGLVGDQQLGFQRQRARDADALALAAG